jgi:hypothetical protein
MELPKVNDIAPESETAWYRSYWQKELVRLGVVLGLGFLLALAGVLYLVVTRPIISARCQ